MKTYLGKCKVGDKISVFSSGRKYITIISIVNNKYYCDDSNVYLKDNFFYKIVD